MKLCFNPTDILKAPRIALSFQRIWIQLLGLIPGYLIYYFFSLLALSTNGSTFAKSWLLYRLLPVFPMNSTNLFGWSIYVFGILLAVYMQLLTATAVSRSAYMLLKGHSFYTWREAWRFAIKKKGSIFFAPTAMFALIACFFVTGWILGLIGTIPWVGPILFGFLTAVLVLCCLLLLFLIILLGSTIILLPAILATTDEDAFEVIFQTVALVWHQPWRLLGSQFFNAILSLFSLAAFAFFTKKAILLFISIYQIPHVVARTFQTNFLNSINQALALLQEWLVNLTRFIDQLFGPWSSFVKAGTYLNHYFPILKKSLIGPEIHLAAVIVAVSFLLIGSAVLAFALATFNTGNTIIYIALRYRKSEENLLDREDAEEKKMRSASESRVKKAVHETSENGEN